MLDVVDVTVSYHSLVALDKVSLHVAAGSIHGVIGPNGAGKSTLMDAITGGNRITTGSITYDGTDISHESIARRRRRGISRSFQRTSIFPDLTIGDQLDMCATRLGRDTLDDVIDALRLRPILGVTASAAAYGDQRRVDIALALLGRAQLIVLDEPAAGLSKAETTTVFDHIATLVRDRGITALIVEHDVDAVFATCDEVTVLDLGHVLTSGKPADVRADPAVIHAYLGTAA